jgi:hypothetical protein
MRSQHPKWGKARRSRRVFTADVGEVVFAFQAMIEESSDNLG